MAKNEQNVDSNEQTTESVFKRISDLSDALKVGPKSKLETKLDWVEQSFNLYKESKEEKNDSPLVFDKYSAGKSIKILAERIRIYNKSKRRTEDEKKNLDVFTEIYEDFINRNIPLKDENMQTRWVGIAMSTYFTKYQKAPIAWPKNKEERFYSEIFERFKNSVNAYAENVAKQKQFVVAINTNDEASLKSAAAGLSSHIASTQGDDQNPSNNPPSLTRRSRKSKTL